MIHTSKLSEDYDSGKNECLLFLKNSGSTLGRLMVHHLKTMF